MSAADADLSVVIPTHRRRDLVSRAVAALARQSLDPALFEIVVVCDGGGDGTAEALRERSSSLAGRPVVRVLEQERSGAATARNRGAEAASGRVLVFLDDDMIAEPGCLAAHRAAHAARPGALVLGAIPVHEDSPRSFLTEGLTRWAERRDAALRGESEVPWDEVLTGHLSAERDTFEKVGRFDPAFTAGGTFGGEDIEFGWRAKARGVAVAYAPEAVARQVFLKGFAALCRDIRQAAAADVALARKHPEAAARLTLGRAAEMPPHERRALELTLRAPRVASAAFAPVRAALAIAARAGATGRRWEHLHAVVRAHLYGAGLLDAGWAKASRTR